MNNIAYSEREKTYMNVLVRKGEAHQLAVAVEELSECQKEVCKFLRGFGNLNHLAEEIADATIMLEQLKMIFQCEELVSRKMDEKILRLDAKLRSDVNL